MNNNKKKRSKVYQRCHLS